MALALKQSGLYTHLSAQQAAAAVAAAAAEAAAARAATNGQAGAAAGQARLPVNLSSLTPVPRSQLNLDVGREQREREEIMAARVKEAAIMQVRRVCCLFSNLKFWCYNTHKRNIRQLLDGH